MTLPPFPLPPGQLLDPDARPGIWSDLRRNLIAAIPQVPDAALEEWLHQTARNTGGRFSHDDQDGTPDTFIVLAGVHVWGGPLRDTALIWCDRASRAIA